MSVQPIVPDPVAVLTVQPDGDLSLVVICARVMTLPQVRESLSEAEKAIAAAFNETPASYIAGGPDEADQAEGYIFRDEWVFTPRPSEGVEIVEAEDGEVWAIAASTVAEDEVRGSSDELGQSDLLTVLDLEGGMRGWVFRPQQYTRAA